MREDYDMIIFYEEIAERGRSTYAYECVPAAVLEAPSAKGEIDG